MRKTTAILNSTGTVLQQVAVCPSCGGGHTVRHGFNVTKKGKFARRKCQDCGTTFYENREGGTE